MTIVCEFVYCTGILAAIIARPHLKFQWGFGDMMPELYIDYYQMLRTILISALLSGLALLPSLYCQLMHLNVIQQRRRRIQLSILSLPWVIICCVMFVHNLLLKLVAIHYTELPDAKRALYIGTLVYCAIFCLATEIMLHWLVIYFLEKDNVITYIKNPPNDFIFN